MAGIAAGAEAAADEAEADEDEDEDEDEADDGPDIGADVRMIEGACAKRASFAFEAMAVLLPPLAARRIE